MWRRVLALMVVTSVGAHGCTESPGDGAGGTAGNGGGGQGGGGQGGGGQGGGGQGGGGEGGGGGSAPEPVVEVAAGFAHTCVRLKSGAVRCWGSGAYGQLGYGNSDSIGDVMTPAAVGAGNVNVGGSAVEVVLGDDHTCARSIAGSLWCWGRGEHGRLGHGNLDNVGVNETPASVGPVNPGWNVVGLAAAWSHTCAILATGKVRCWGSGSNGKLGYGNTNDIGDDESPAGEVDLGLKAAETVVQLAAGDEHTCAVLSTGKVRCWGHGLYGQLGYGNTNNVGDTSTPASAGDVDVGLKLNEKVVQLAAGYAHTCALLNTGKVRCWGANGSGQLGYGNSIMIGDDEAPASAGDVDVGGTVKQIVAGYVHTCALLADSTVRCWGQGNVGQLGYGSVFNVGDGGTPAGAGAVQVGGAVKALAAGYAHTCAIVAAGAVKCWGFNGYGQLGRGNIDNIGDDEFPSAVGAVQLF